VLRGPTSPPRSGPFLGQHVNRQLTNHRLVDVHAETGAGRYLRGAVLDLDGYPGGVHGIFELAGGITAQINSSWAVRVYRDELVEFQVDGTHGSAVAGLRNCRIQHRGATPMPVWNPDLPASEDFRSQWQTVPDNEDFDNGFKVQWEAFLRHVVDNEPFPWDFMSGVRGVQLAELGLRSAREGRRIQIEEIGR
jgi:predicted dehydrogenase